MNGGTEVTVSAMAYKDAKVTATLGGQSIQLVRDTAEDDSTDKDTNFVKFSGKFPSRPHLFGAEAGQH